MIISLYFFPSFFVFVWMVKKLIIWLIITWLAAKLGGLPMILCGPHFYFKKFTRSIAHHLNAVIRFAWQEKWVSLLDTCYYSIHSCSTSSSIIFFFPEYQGMKILLDQRSTSKECLLLRVSKLLSAHTELFNWEWEAMCVCLYVYIYIYI